MGGIIMLSYLIIIAVIGALLGWYAGHRTIGVFLASITLGATGAYTFMVQMGTLALEWNILSRALLYSALMIGVTFASRGFKSLLADREAAAKVAKAKKAEEEARKAADKAAERAHQARA